jgi:hypothetical protein
VDGSGTALFEHVCKLDLEGAVAKQRSAPYISSREGLSTLQVFHGKVLTTVVRSSSTSSVYTGVVRQNEIVSSNEVKSRANLSRPVVVAAQWVNQHEIMLGFEAVQESILT